MSLVMMPSVPLKGSRSVRRRLYRKRERECCFGESAAAIERRQKVLHTADQALLFIITTIKTVWAELKN